MLKLKVINEVKYPQSYTNAKVIKGTIYDNVLALMMAGSFIGRKEYGLVCCPNLKSSDKIKVRKDTYNKCFFHFEERSL